MNDQFDELAKTMAQSVTRRGALKKLGLGLAGIALTSLWLANKAEAIPGCKCHEPDYGCGTDSECVSLCAAACQKKKGGPY
jgi:hypothetical protein